MVQKLLVFSLAALFSACNLTAAQDATLATQTCNLIASITKQADPSAPATVQQVFGVVCPDIEPIVTDVGTIASLAKASGPPVQCTAWTALDDSKRYGGNGVKRPSQVVCADLAATVESEIAKAPDQRKKPVRK